MKKSQKGKREKDTLLWVGHRNKNKKVRFSCQKKYLNAHAMPFDTELYATMLGRRIKSKHQNLSNQKGHKK